MFPTAWFFDVSEFGEAICSGVILDLGNHPKTEFKDSFQIYYFPSEPGKEAHPGILELFDIEASKGVVQRYCHQCEKLCVIDGETMDNYFSYVALRTEFTKIEKAIFAARFHFPECSHPITPEVPKNLGMVQTVDLSHIFPESHFHS